MTIELERKFILGDPPPAEDLGPGVRIRQGYLAEEGEVEVRVRITAAGATLTVKAGTGSRTEVEVPVPQEQAAELWPHTAGRRIDKTRYRVPLNDPGNHVAEVDVYEGSLVGLSVVEVEFDSVEDSLGFRAPGWFGRELTDEPGWSNAALARRGRPD